MDNIENDNNSNTSNYGSGMEEPRSELGGMPGSGGSGSMGGIKGMASQAGEKLMDTAERQKMAGADFVSGMADAVRRAAGEFEGQSPQAAQYIRYAADQIDSMTDSFRRRDVGQMLQDVQDFARRQPTAFLGVSFLAGFAAIRFLRSSSSGSRMGSGMSGGSSSWQQREPYDSGRYGSSSSSGMPDMPGAGTSSPGSMTPGMSPGSGV